MLCHALIYLSIKIPAFEDDKQSILLCTLPKIIHVGLTFFYRLLFKLPFHFVLGKATKGEPRITSIIFNLYPVRRLIIVWWRRHR